MSISTVELRNYRVYRNRHIHSNEIIMARWTRLHQVLLFGVFASLVVYSKCVSVPVPEGRVDDPEVQTTEWSGEGFPTNLTFPLFEGQDELFNVEKRQTSEDQCYLIFANRRFVVKVSTAGRILAVFREGLINAIGLDYDLRLNLYFVSDVAQRKIFIGNLTTGRIIRTFNECGIHTPDGIAWDWVTHKLYWTDAECKVIGVFDPFRGYCKVLIETGETSIPRAIVLDPFNKVLYWTDWGTPAKIERASLDGTSRWPIQDRDLQWPNALTLDYDSQTLYWADAGLDKLESSGVDGSNRTVLSTAYLPHPFGITFHNGSLYWSDWAYNAILAAPVNQFSALRAVISGLIFDPQAIHCVDPDRQQPAVNPCEIDNGGCSHLCLLSTTHRHGYVCCCPPNTTDCVEHPVCSPTCVHGECIGGRCVCDYGWEGTTCDEPICDPMCQNGGMCTSPGTCNCTSGWQGVLCDRPICDPPCRNGGTCTDPNVCNCPDEYEGDYCESPICEPSCENGGTCSAPGICVCPPNFRGDHCEIVDCDPPCRNGGYCDTRSGVCICPQGLYEGEDCTTPVCFPPGGCLNGGVCIRPQDCSCANGWEGFQCETAECNPECVHGDCIRPDECHCHEGWTGTLCDRAVCFPPDGCLHGGHCIYPGICSCTTGWIGEKCDTAICLQGCVNGDCAFPDLCVCHVGWTGLRCTEAVCLPPCQNGGTCAHPGVCVCTGGYEGSNCEEVAKD